MKKRKQKRYTFCRCVHIDMFRCSVIVLCGDLDSPELRKAYEKEHDRTMAKTAPSYDEVVSTIKDYTREYIGLSCIRDNADCYLYLPEWSCTCFIHEAYHAATGIMNRRDVVDSSTEVGAYLIEYLFGEIVNTKWSDAMFFKNHFRAPKSSGRTHNRKKGK